ncbi:hypothetical protein Scep_012506 [Stephania cephalantha]|uniref:Uncharacterized protein n=1 Tax=Stephania cephalantha TaxID=152367 RepID=A0AAP0JGZ6_9MAGN
MKEPYPTVPPHFTPFSVLYTLSISAKSISPLHLLSSPSVSAPHLSEVNFASPYHLFTFVSAPYLRKLYLPSPSPRSRSSLSISSL